ncbi:hypothetical protein [Arthrobacter sp. A5]|uniref:hypothetical protein n=1 Tax=Arthrobacter sp. A5 TaxID=576926 RepID=UPI003DA8F9E6
MANEEVHEEEPGSTVRGSSEARGKESYNRRGSPENLAPGEVTKDAKGLGAIFGDADRSAVDDPVKPPSEAESAAMTEMDKKFTSHESESGEKYLTEGD